MTLELKKWHYFVFLFALTLFLTYPIWLHPSEFLLRSDAPDFPGDFFLYRSYVAHFQKFFMGESPIGQMEYGFYQAGVSCADAECSPAFSVPAGLLSFLVGPLRALNLFLVAFVFLSGVAMFYFAKEFMGEKSALVSAALFMTSNYFLAEMLNGHMNLLQSFWVILAFLFLERIIKNPHWKNSIFLGLILVGQAYASTQYLLFLVIMLPLYLLLRNYRILADKNFWKYILISLLVFVVLAVPYLLNFVGGQPKERNLAENMFFSVGLPGNTFSYPLLNIMYALSPFAPVYILFPLLFAGGAILLSREVKKWQLPFLVLILISFFLSLGPIVSFAPYSILYSFFPFFSSMRTPSRFFFFVVIFLSLIGGGVVTEIEKKFAKKLGKAKFVSHPALVGLLALLILFSLLSPYVTARYTEPIETYGAGGLYEYLGGLPAGTAVEYPLVYDCAYLYHAELHGKPLFGGCAAFPPKFYYNFIEACGIDLLNLPNSACQALVREYDIRYVVYHSEKYEAGFEEFIQQEPRLKLLKKSGTAYLFEVLFDQF